MSGLPVPDSVRARYLAGCTCDDYGPAGTLDPAGHAEDCPARARLAEAFMALDAPEPATPGAKAHEAGKRAAADPQAPLFDAPTIRRRPRRDFTPS